ncbi:MAG: hypothetical protein WBI91_05905, partial [Coriobacteriia bacterium]
MARTVEVSGEDAKSSESGFPVYAKGEYIGEIIDVKNSVAAKQGLNAGKPAIDLKVRFTESSTGEGIGKRFTVFRVPVFPEWASGSVAFLFYQFFKAVGVVFPEKGKGAVELPDNEDLLGQEVGVILDIEEDQNGNPRN